MAFVVLVVAITPDPPLSSSGDRRSSHTGGGETAIGSGEQRVVVGVGGRRPRAPLCCRRSLLGRHRRRRPGIPNNKDNESGI